jgi:hypothetical protein
MTNSATASDFPFTSISDEAAASIQAEGHVGLSQAFVVFEPQAGLTVNALKRVSLRAGIGYRLTASEWTRLSSINGVTGTFGAQIGW